MNYTDISKEFQSLDLILFSGTDFFSNGIKFIEKFVNGAGDFSHVGILINSNIITNIQQLVPNKWYVLESTFSSNSGILEYFTDGIPNILTNKGFFGVQIRDFEQLVQHYSGKIAWTRLLHNPCIYSFDNTKKIMVELLTKYLNKPYDYNCLDILATVIPCLRNPRDLLNKFADEFYVSWDIKNPPSEWLFCSELVANIYQTLGLINKNCNPQDITPQDFLGGDPDGLNVIVQKPVIYINGHSKDLPKISSFNENLLVKKFCPIFIFNKNEKYLPSSILINSNKASCSLYYECNLNKSIIYYYYFIPKFNIVNCITINMNNYPNSRPRIYVNNNHYMFTTPTHFLSFCDTRFNMVWDPQYLIEFNNMKSYCSKKKYNICNTILQ